MNLLRVVSPTKSKIFPFFMTEKSSYHNKRPQNSAVIDKIGKNFKATRIDLEHDIGVSAGV